MPLKYKSATIQPNQSASFTFDDDIAFYAAGIAYYSFTFKGSGDHHVHQCSLSLSVNKSSSRQVSVTAHGVLEDSSGHGMDDAKSSVTVVVLAWTGAAPGSVTLVSKPGIPDDGQSSAVTLPASDLPVLQAALAGFDLAYDGDHHVEEVSFSVGATQDGTLGYIDGWAVMRDKTGHMASTATVDGLLFASAQENIGFALQALPGLQETVSKVTVDFSSQLPADTQIKSAAVLLTAFDAQFSDDSDHHLKTISGGPSGWGIDPNDGQNVQLDKPCALMIDSSDHHQDDALSNVGVVVVATY